MLEKNRQNNELRTPCHYRHNASKSATNWHLNFMQIIERLHMYRLYTLYSLSVLTILFAKHIFRKSGNANYKGGAHVRVLSRCNRLRINN